MRTPLRTTTTRRSGIGLEITLTFLLLAVGAGALLKANPIQLSPRTADVQLAPPPQSGSAPDVLVVLPTVPEAHSLETLAFDQTWLNSVEREIGPYRTVDTAQLTRSVMDPCAWVIVPKRAASQLDPTQTQFVRNWVEDGGTVILEQPEGPWRGLIGQSIAPARVRETRRITSFDGALSRGEMRADILEMPFQTTLAPYNPPELTRGRDYQVLLEVDGQPGVVTLHIGRGRVVLVLFDFGRAAVQVMQGLPNGDFSLPLVEGRDPAVGTFTSDLVADDELRTTHIPFVDLLERNLLYLADVHRPVGRLWAYPGTSRGALVVGHSEARYGPAARYMPEWEHEHEHASSVFAVAGSLSPEELARIGRIEADLQLQWVPVTHPAAPQRTWGVRHFRPIRRRMNLSEQLTQLNHDANPYGPAIATSALDRHWSNNYFTAFEQLEAAGVAIDSSYGPPPAHIAGSTEHFGYLFGTGRPFHPIDRNGNRFRLYELPVSVDASANGYSASGVRSLIVDSSEGYHTTIAADWRPDVMALRPSFDAIEGWQRAFELAASQELWTATYAEYVDFLRRRTASTVESTFSREERRLTIEARVEGADLGPEDDEETIIATTPSVAFPTRFEGRPVERLIVDNESVETSALALTGDRVLHVLPLSPGSHRIQVIYGSPIEAPLP